ncbi:MAG: hypothetical protein L6V80_06255 [Bacteroidales bacterium]|nr:MAG: hypothetical protein L6V80_06255 [Bacteroidales bacterium]
MDEMALDGTLWVEDGKPYMVYCHEWVQVMDGEMKVVELTRDLSAREGYAAETLQRLGCRVGYGLARGGRRPQLRYRRMLPLPHFGRQRR